MRWYDVCMGITVTATGCGKVPIVDVAAGFEISNAAWYQDEETLFFFYRVDAEQGLGPESSIEVTYRTDEMDQPWADITGLPAVHSHVTVSCGPRTLCGSRSLHVSSVPRDVGIRLRYHRDGAMSLASEVAYNVIGSGPAHTHRSLLIYGVFDQRNERVQWRSRHQFPMLRNEEAQALGLRRYFSVSGEAVGTLPEAARQVDDNPYGYGLLPTCPAEFQALADTAVETTERAVWSDTVVPLPLSDAPTACAPATVTDGIGSFTASAMARRNPEVRPAFPVLRSPVHPCTAIGFLLTFCGRVISEAHQTMQRQRLQLDGEPELCLDDWQEDGFVDALATTMLERIDRVRAEGQDLVLKLALHHDVDSGRLAASIEAALAAVLGFEADKSSPRVVGAFVFDSYARAVSTPDLGRLVLWCPANLPDKDLEAIPDAAMRSCPILPDDPTLTLGPFSFRTLPILPTRDQYLTFVAKYSEGQAGGVRQLSFSAPERTPVSENIPMEQFGVATFFNGEVLTADEDDAFSYCAPDDVLASPVVFRFTQSPLPLPLPLMSLPEAHGIAPQASYELGLFWDFPFLLRVDYRIVLAGAASAFSLTVPFGVGNSNTSYYGTTLWEQEEFSVSDLLRQCTRFCAHPTFDSAGVYNVNAPFSPLYYNRCYRPRLPQVGDGGFPRDP